MLLEGRGDRPVAPTFFCAGDCFASLAMTTPCPAHHPKNKNMLLLGIASLRSPSGRGLGAWRNDNRFVPPLKKKYSSDRKKDSHILRQEGRLCGAWNKYRLPSPTKTKKPVIRSRGDRPVAPTFFCAGDWQSSAFLLHIHNMQLPLRHIATIYGILGF